MIGRSLETRGVIIINANIKESQDFVDFFLYIYIDPQEKIPTLKTFRHKPSSGSILEGLFMSLKISL